MAKSDAQDKVYLTILTLSRRYGYPPSVRDICEEAGLSTGSVTLALDGLEKDGKITRQPKKARTIRVVNHVKD